MTFPRRRSSFVPYGLRLVIVAILAALVTQPAMVNETHAQSSVPAAPTGLIATSVSHDGVTLSWDDPGDTSITGYQVLRRDIVNQAPGTFSTVESDTGSAATTYTDSTVEAETRYVYRVKAINSEGTSGQSNYVNVETPAAPTLSVPAQPTGLTATSVSHDSVTLSWDDPGDDTITGYQVLRRSRDGNEYGDGQGDTQFVAVVDDTGTSATTYTDTTVAARTRYVYRVKAINSVGMSGTSSYADATTDDSQALEITSPGQFKVAEGSTAVAVLAAADSHTALEDLVWSRHGGADSDVFSVSADGVLAFVAAKDFENPDDADANGSYEVTVQVSDGTATATAALVVSLENVIELASSISGPTAVSFAENSATRVATFSASSEEDGDGVEWVLGGTDAAQFRIDSPAGALRFDIDPVAPKLFPEPPDFEHPADADTDNAYSITLLARSGSSTTAPLEVTISVTDVDEAGELLLSSTRPRTGAELTATLSDPDGVTNGTTAWEWERNDGREGWETIAGATSTSYTPTAADGDRYLRVRATYTDDFGSEKTAETMAPHVVIAHRLSAITVSGLTGVPGDGRAFYPAFDPDTLHYAARCTESVTMTLTTEDVDTRLAVNGTQKPKGRAFTVSSLGRETDIRIELSGPSGGRTTYIVHCLDRQQFPKLTTVKSEGAMEDLMMFRAKWRPGDVPRRSALIMMDNNGVPRLRKWIEDNVMEYFRAFASETDARAGYVFTKQGENYYRDKLGAELVVLDEYFNVEDDGVHILSPFNNTNGHDQRVLPNGDYLLMGYSDHKRDMRFLQNAFPGIRANDGYALTESEWVKDGVIQVRKPDGTVEFNWSSWDHMAIEDCVGGGRFTPEYAHINSLGLVDGDIIAGFRHCSKILRIDMDTGDVVWRAGPSILSRKQWETGQTLKPDRGPAPLDFINDPRGGFSGQHGGHMTVDGNLLVYDNATHCKVPPGVPEDAKGLTQCFSRTRGVEYALDLPNEELVFLREFRMPGFGVQGGLAGHAEPLSNGDWIVSWSYSSLRSMPNTAMHVDAATGMQKLSMTLENIAGSSDVGKPFHTRVVAVSPVALADKLPALSATLPESTSTSDGHSGSTDSPQVVVSFNQPVADFDESTSSISATGATVASVSPHVSNGEKSNAYIVTLTPNGNDSVTLRVVANQDCANGGICTADGRRLSNQVELTIPHTANLSVVPRVAYQLTGSALKTQVATTVALEWNDVPYAESYDIQHWQGGQWIDLPASDTDFDGSSAVIRGLPERDVHHFRVRSSNTHGASAWSYHLSVTTMNSPATGAPAIHGTVQVGETLTVDISGVSDTDGLDNAAYAYQWISSDGTTDTVIVGATSSTYGLQASDAGKAIRVRVSFTDDNGNEEELTSAATAAVTATVPGVPRAIDVEPGGAGELDVSWEGPDTDGGSPVTGYKVQWKEVADSWDTSEDVSEATATSTSYSIVSLSLGVEYSVRVIATNSIGDGPASEEVKETSDAQTSQQQGVTSNNPATGTPSISGTPVVGQTLDAATSGVGDADGLVNAAFTYQWIRSDGTTDTDISGATNSSYTLVSDDEGRFIKVRVSFTDDGGNDEVLTSATTSAVEAALTGELQNVPDSHDGSGTFTFRVLFSESVTVGYAALKQHSFQVTNAKIKRAQRVNGRSDLRKFTIQPSSDSNVILVLPVTEDCADEGAICTSDGKRLSTRLEIIVPGPAPENSAAAGAPTISGTPQVGQTLSASTSVISDADGLSTATFSYQWLADGSEIGGATTRTYTLVDADEGKAISVRVSFTDDRGNEETVTSAATIAVSSNDQQEEQSTSEPTDRPHGLHASVDAGTVALDWNAPDDASSVTMYRILRHRPEEGESEPLVYVDYTHSTATSYTDTEVEPGTLYTYSVQAADFLGYVGEASDPASVRVPGSNSAATGAPTIAGAAQAGQTLRVDTSGISDANGMTGATFSYQWVSYDGTVETDIQGATDSTYVLGPADEGKAFRVRVSFTDDAGFDESLTSALARLERPYGLDASESDGAVVLTWKLPVGWSTGSTFQILRNRPELGETEPLVHVRYFQGGGNSYTDTDVEPGVLYVYRVKGVDPFGYTGEASEPVEIRTAGPVTVDEPKPPSNSNNPATGPPSISGTARVGADLRASLSDLDDADGLSGATFSYQWMADGTDIPAATGSRYTPVAGDAGKAITVRVSFTDDAGNEESLTSEPTEAVAP